MKESFRTWKPNKSSLIILEKINAILEHYRGLRIKVTLRQLYYQLVSKAIIPNEQRQYKMLGSLLSKARMAGLVDWDIIEDRGRRPHIIQDFVDLNDLVSDAVGYFRLPRWDDQENYVELWTEKDAISSVLEPITSRLHLPLIVNKGYSSTTAMKDAADRIKAQDKEAHILYLGDLDPSGEDMVRDIEERLYEFDVTDFTMTKIALNPKQVKHYKLPTNPVKITDSRHQGFMDKFGEHCYEVDAIPPEELQLIVTKAIEALMDMDAFNDVLAEEDVLREKLQEHTKEL